MSNTKKPKLAVPARVSKIPAIAMGVPQADLHPAWRLRWLDHDGPWGWAQATAEELRQIVQFLKEMERLTWQQIWAQHAGGERRRGQKHKFIPMVECEPTAQKRLRSLNLEEYDGDWFRFRLMGQQRLWGVIREGYFFAVWWDPRHQVCPSKDR